MAKRRAYPKEPKHQMTEAWKQVVRDLIEAHPDGVTWLAREIGVHHAAIIKALDPERNQRTSSIVPGVCRVFGIAPPMADSAAAIPVDLDEKTLLERFRRLDEKGRGTALGFIAGLSTSPEKGE